MSDLGDIYILGSEGYIGTSILRKLHELSISSKTVGRREKNDVFIDLSKLSTKSMNGLQPGDRFICLAANSSPADCAENYDSAYKINVSNTALLIEKLLDSGVYVLFASSDVVYGRTELPVDERDNINPTFSYAEMKAEIENKFLGNDLFKVMRLSYVWSLHDKFTRYLLQASEKKTVVDIFDPFIRSIISLEDVVDFVLRFIHCPGELPNVVNLAGPEFISRVQLVEDISQYLSIDFRVSKPDEEFFKFRPDQILLRSIYLENALGRPVYNLHDIIRKKLKRSENGA